MDVLNRALFQGLGTEFLDQIYPELVILISGKVIAIGDEGLALYEKDCISWTTLNMVANFTAIQDAPFLPTNYGTVSILDEPFPNIVNIQYDGCKVSFNHAFWKKNRRNVSFTIDYYKRQLQAKVRAWDERIAQVFLFGDAVRGIPGLLNGSGISLLTSTVNLSTAPVDQVISEVVSLVSYVANNTENAFRPTLLSFPQDLINILINRRYGAADSTDLWTLIKDSIIKSPAFEDVTPSFTSVPQFNTNKIGCVMPSDPKMICGVAWELEEFYSPDDSESREDDNGSEGYLASAHEGGYAGIIARRNEAGIIIQYLY
jgi:hypothetical protein